MSSNTFGFNKNIFLVLLMFSVSVASMAQPEKYVGLESYGTWTTVGVQKKINKWDFEAETELRTIYLVRLIERWSFGLGADYSLSKFLKVGVGYQFMNKLDYNTEYTKYYFSRNRFNASATGKLKLSDFTFSLRERVQLTMKEERLRIDGTDDDYKANPDISWRNKLQVSYNIPKCKITPSLSAESFYDLNNPAGNGFDNIRYILSFDYKLNKQNKIELYGVLNSELESEDAYGRYVLGVAYRYSF